MNPIRNLHLDLFGFSALLVAATWGVGAQLVPAFSTLSQDQTMSGPTPQELNRHGFDFLTGTYVVHNHRRVRPLAGDDRWEDFEATNRCWPVLGGVGNSDEFKSERPAGFIGMSLRLFDTNKREWSIYWIDNRTGVLQPPVVGSFTGYRGVFEGDDLYKGTPIRVRYVWSSTNTATPRWEQSFSTDGGKTWEVNWVMDFERTTAFAEARGHVGAGSRS
jgi:hypothetical protein